MCSIGKGLNQPQYKHPPNQLPDTPSNNEITINHLFDLFWFKTNTPKSKTKVKQRALIGSTLTQGAWTKIGKITKKEDHSLKDLGFDKKLSSYESTVL